MESVRHTDTLISAGMPIMFLCDFENMLYEWVEEDWFKSTLGQRIHRFKRIIPLIIERDPTRFLQFTDVCCSW